MAKGFKTGGRDFQKGHPGGPGQPRLPADIVAVRKITSALFESIVAKYLNSTKAEIEAVIANPDTPMLELHVCKFLLEGAKDGNTARLNFLLERTLGKVKDQVEISLPKPTIVKSLEGPTIILGSKVEHQEEEQEQ